MFDAQTQKNRAYQCKSGSSPLQFRLSPRVSLLRWLTERNVAQNGAVCDTQSYRIQSLLAASGGGKMEKTYENSMQ
jgi:hypothetical protein